MDGQRKRKSRDKGFYARQAKRGRMGRFRLVPGIRGFLLFTNHRERDAIREAYALLNARADELLGKEEREPAAEVESAEEEDDGDVEAAVAREREAMEREHKSDKPRRFQKVETGAQNLLFVRTEVEDPVGLAVSVLEELKRGGVRKTQNLIRLVPVEMTCKAFAENISGAVAQILPKHFEPHATPTYCVAFKARLNNSLTKEELVQVVNAEIKKLCPGAKVEYKDPTLTVIVEVMKSHACLSVIPGYSNLKRCNTIEIVQIAEEMTKSSENLAQCGESKEGGCSSITFKPKDPITNATENLKQ